MTGTRCGRMARLRSARPMLFGVACLAQGAALAGPPAGFEWQPIERLSDEFDGDRLDRGKWYDRNRNARGHPPGLIWPANVSVADGMLHLTTRAEEPPRPPPGYHGFTTAAIQSKVKVRYGYFEIRARPSASRVSSAFWFFDRSDGYWTEIDVFEVSGTRLPDDPWYNSYTMTLHVFETPVEDRHWQKQQRWRPPFRMVDGFHRYALDWRRDRIRWLVDGAVVAERENSHWHRPLKLNLDSQTLSDWFGLPDPANLPSSFDIDYVRAWRRVGPAAD